MNSGDALKQLDWGGELEASCQDHDRLQPRRALAALEQADLRSMQLADIRQSLLRELSPLAVMAKVGGKLCAYALHGQELNSRVIQTEVPQT